MLNQSINHEVGAEAVLDINRTCQTTKLESVIVR